MMTAKNNENISRRLNILNYAVYLIFLFNLDKEVKICIWNYIMLIF
jgi:hypothetical protein